MASGLDMLRASSTAYDAAKGQDHRQGVGADVSAVFKRSRDSETHPKDMNGNDSVS